MTTPRIGMCFARTFPAPAVIEFAERLEADGLDELWIIEDCFYTGAVSLAAAALARTERLTVGLGILPAVARQPAITAMEIATLAALGPGRLVAGIGHGVQAWMDQMGATTLSPLTTLEEVIVAVKRLLTGEKIVWAGEHVLLAGVRLEAPPAPVPPVVAGVRGPKSLALAGRVADGLVLAEGTGPDALRAALGRAAPTGAFDVTVFGALCVRAEREYAYAAMSPFVAGLLDDEVPALRDLPFYDDLLGRYREQGVVGLLSMPADWWRAIGPIGTLDDAVAHVAALGEAGARTVALFPDPDLEVGRDQLADVAAIARELG
jgi:5,10-methylenetetrahydromethanopterin reductase